LLEVTNQVAAVWPGTVTEPIHLEETDASLAIAWQGRYRIERPAFVYSTPIAIPATSRPSSAALRRRSLKRADRKI